MLGNSPTKRNRAFFPLLIMVMGEELGKEERVSSLDMLHLETFFSSSLPGETIGGKE
jgi:hypothetical protein